MSIVVEEVNDTIEAMFKGASICIGPEIYINQAQRRIWDDQGEIKSKQVQSFDIEAKRCLGEAF